MDIKIEIKSLSGKTAGRRLLYGALISCLFMACTCKRKPAVPEVPPVNLSLTRFDHELFSLDTARLAEEAGALRARHEGFFDLYIRDIMKMQGPADTPGAYIPLLRSFLVNTAVRSLHDSCANRFKDTGTLEKELEMAFGRFSHYFPEERLPHIYTFISEFGYGVVTSDTLLGIGLDLFLGKDFSFYPAVGLPQYLYRKLDRAYLLPAVMTAYLHSLYEREENDASLLAGMIYKGKLQYALELLLPELPDTIRTGYTLAQLGWCEENESQVWAYLLEHNLLYETDMLKFHKFINDGPTTAGMPAESPGNIGSWVGWRIVRKFMESSPGTTLPALFGSPGTNAQKILNLSGYKPKKSRL